MLDPFERSLLRIASLQGRGVLESIVTGQFSIIAAGKIMVSASATNKSFAFTVPDSLTTDKLMSHADKALAYFDSHSSDEVTNILKSRGNRIAFARF